MPSVTSLIKSKILEIDGRTIASFSLENGSITLARKNGNAVPSDEGETSVLLISNDTFSDLGPSDQGGSSTPPISDDDFSDVI